MKHCTGSAVRYTRAVGVDVGSAVGWAVGIADGDAVGSDVGGATTVERCLATEKTLAAQPIEIYLLEALWAMP